MSEFPCPICNAPTKVYDSRLQPEYVRRRRECDNGHRFRTAERVSGLVRPSPLRKTQVEPQTMDDYDDALEVELRAERGW